MSKAAKKKPTKTTPGPYKIRASPGNGYHVLGTHGVSVAWFPAAGVWFVGGHHVIGMRECKSNAKLFVSALQAAESKGCHRAEKRAREMTKGNA